MTKKFGFSEEYTTKIVDSANEAQQNRYLSALFTIEKFEYIRAKIEATGDINAAFSEYQGQFRAANDDQNTVETILESDYAIEFHERNQAMVTAMRSHVTPSAKTALVTGRGHLLPYPGGMLYRDRAAVWEAVQELNEKSNVSVVVLDTHHDGFGYRRNNAEMELAHEHVQEQFFMRQQKRRA